MLSHPKKCAEQQFAYWHFTFPVPRCLISVFTSHLSNKRCSHSGAVPTSAFLTLAFMESWNSLGWTGP